MSFPLIDVIIPCYNCASTLERAVYSVLKQPYLGKVWLIDDASTDQTAQIAQQLVEQFPHKIHLERLYANGGVAKARNWGALQSQNEFIAFLDADDAYEEGALETVASVFHYCPEVMTIRLALKPIDISEHYRQHPKFDLAWQYMRMTCGGNTAFQRAFFLACGGFPQHQLFRELGGEDGALGIATTKTTMVATLFDEAGVLHYCREGMHAERLLNSILFNQHPEEITQEKLAEANAVTEHICQQLQRLKCGLNSENLGIHPLRLKRTTE